jgi:hypothetical protein
LTDKTRRSKISDSDAMAISNNSNTNQFNNQSSFFINSQQQPQPPPVQPIKMRNMLLPKQYSDKSDYSIENDDTLYTNTTKPTFQAQEQPLIPKRQQPVVPLVRSRIRDASQTSRSPINVNDDQKLYGQQLETAQFNSPNSRSGITNTNAFFDANANLNGDNFSTNINENLTGKHLQTIAQTTNSLNYRPPSPPSPPPITTKPTGQRQLPQPIKVRQQPQPQLQQKNINNPYLPQEWPDADISSSTIN